MVSALVAELNFRQSGDWFDEIVRRCQNLDSRVEGFIVIQLSLMNHDESRDSGYPLERVSAWATCSKGVASCHHRRMRSRCPPPGSRNDSCPRANLLMRPFRSITSRELSAPKGEVPTLDYVYAFPRGN